MTGLGRDSFGSDVGNTMRKPAAGYINLASSSSLLAIIAPFRHPFPHYTMKTALYLSAALAVAMTGVDAGVHR